MATDLEDMKSLLAHVRSRKKLGDRAKPETYVKHVMNVLTSDTPVVWLSKRHAPLVADLRRYRHDTIKNMVLLAHKGLGWGRAPSAFTHWFTQQFGPPPIKDPAALERTKDEVARLEAQLGELQRRLKRQEQYDEHERAAMYAWQARAVSPKGLAKARPRARGVH